MVLPFFVEAELLWARLFWLQMYCRKSGARLRRKFEKPHFAATPLGIDQGRVREYDSRDRRSLYRLFSRFSGCEETELLSDVERTAYALPP